MTLQWGRGLSTPEIKTWKTTSTLSPTFNGAGVFRPRKCGLRRRQKHEYAGLQWGRGLSTPEIGHAEVAIDHIDRLQWGRGLSTPEMLTL